LTLDQVFVGQWRSLFKLPQNRNAPTIHLNRHRFQNSTPMGAQISKKRICYLNKVAQDMKMITVSGWNWEKNKKQKTLASLSKTHLRHTWRHIAPGVW